jgi:hypothetical protein
VSDDFSDFFKKQLPLCMESPFNDTLNQMTFGEKYGIIERSWEDYDADLVSKGCPRAHMCRGGNMCFGRPLPDYPELANDLKRITNIKKGSFEGKPCLVVYPTFCTTITQFNEKSSCPFVSSCNTQCATMSSRLNLEDSVDSVGDESTLEFNDELDYSAMRYEHVAKPTETRDDICWYGVTDRAKKIVELYDLWALDFDEIALQIGDNKGNVFRSYNSAIKKLKRNAKITKAALSTEKYTYRSVSKISGETAPTTKSVIDWVWVNSPSFRLALLGLTGGLSRPDAPNPFTLDLDGGGEDHTDPTGSTE